MQLLLHLNLNRQGGQPMKLINQIKSLAHQLKILTLLSKKLTTQQKSLSDKLNYIQTVSDDIQDDINKMKFKNKPHIDRIQEASNRINAELSKYRA